MRKVWVVVALAAISSCQCLEPVEECRRITSCSAEGKDCGPISDGCGGTLECGTCAAPLVCGGAGPNRCGPAGNCRPKTCSNLGATCGSAPNGCGGMLSCGTCSQNLTCQNNQCIPSCTLRTCAELGVECGPVADGCGGLLNCGDCGPGLACSQFRCVTACTPTTCSQQAAECGSVSDGCGSQLSCGSCSPGRTCVGNRCILQCTPRTCAQLSAECGVVSDGCGTQLNCGGCGGSQSCTGNRCVATCTPSTCADQALVCGTTSDGCGAQLNCGTCTMNETCLVGRCVCTGTGCVSPPVLTGVRLTPTSTRLSWTFPVMTATSFELERSVDGVNFGPLAQPAGTARQFDDAMQVRGTRYWYRIRAITSVGPQSWSMVVRIDGAPSGTNTWRTLGGDIGHTGYNALEQGRPPLSLRWTVTGLGGVDPVVVDGERVYAVSDRLLSAFDAADGGTSWTHPFPGVHSVGQPAVFDGQVYVAHCNHSNDTKLWSFNPQTGSTNWSVAMSAQWEKYWAPIKVGNGVYTNGGSYGGLYGFDAMSGANFFFHSMLAQYDEWSPASDGNLVYTFVAGIFRAHHPLTGAMQWQTSVTWNWRGWSALTSPVISNGMAYVIAPPNLHAIDLSTRTVRWTASGLNFSGTPAVANGVVYAVSAGNVRAHDAATGAFLWTFVGDGALSYPPVLTQTHLFASSNSQVFAVDLVSHAQVWSAPGGGWLSLANGSLYTAGPTIGLRAYSLTP